MQDFKEFFIKIITKELGTIVFNTEKAWRDFKISSVTLHSLTEPSYVEINNDIYNFYNPTMKNIWFKDGLHHRSNAPAVYTIVLNGDTKISHQFKIEDSGDCYYNNIKINSMTQIYNVQFYLNGQKYLYRIGRVDSKFILDSMKYNRISKLTKLFKD